MAKRRQYEELEDIELSPEEDAAISQKIYEAEAELEELRISFRWGKDQLLVVKKAAKKMGVPYQTFMKMAVFQHALDVLEDIEATG